MLTKKDDFFDRVLIDGALLGCDTIKIVSGYAASTMASRHIERLRKEKLSVKVELIIGMAASGGISESEHALFSNIIHKPDSFECSYYLKNPGVHSKLYIWCKEGRPISCYIGSANYTQQGFFSKQKEILTSEVDLELALQYFNNLSRSDDVIFCNHQDVENRIIFKKAELPDIFQSDVWTKTDRNTVELPLWSKRQNKMHEASGLNWGQRPEAKREPNQAYIPIPSSIAKSGFFPPRGQHFTVTADDNHPFIMVVAQDGDKALHTPNNNSELGIYFRRRLEVPLGQKVELSDLDRYGRRDVTFTKISEDDYIMAFNQTKNL